MKRGIYTSLGECAGDEEVVKALSDWVSASDACAASSDEDYHLYWPACNAAQDKLGEYFTSEAIQAFIFGMNDIRRILRENL